MQTILDVIIDTSSWDKKNVHYVLQPEDANVYIEFLETKLALR